MGEQRAVYGLKSPGCLTCSWQTRALRELTSITSLVVATGGGAVVRRENW